jgi:haloacid dehalogenase superfamily, subfamily IA, variant 1 with third motif having Dx(3-4)D or Dx(3-4)E
VSVTAEYDAVVYDLDGTLVRLAVDWSAVRRDTVAAVREAGRSPGESLWDLLDRSHSEGFADIVEPVIAEHECRGARAADRLPTAAELPRAVPVGVCSLNSEAACRLALRRHGLASHVDTVVGRDTVGTYKPDPEPLLSAVRDLSATPGQTLFIGDSERDQRTAERAGVAFEYVEDRS